MATLDRWLDVLAFVAAIGSALIGGVFFAFSTFVMKALARRPAHEAIAAMQSINVAVINPMFLGVFLGTAGVCATAAIGGLWRWARPGAGYIICGSATYLVGTFLVTMVCNVPLNNDLARLAPDDSAGTGRWADYVRRWTRWNHVRTIAALAAAGALTLARGP